MQVLSTLPPDFTGNNTTTEIAVDQASCQLTRVGWQSTDGRAPRYFGLDLSGTLLYAGNQDSDTVVTFRIDPATGKLTPTSQVVQTGSPVTIVLGG